MAEDPTPASPSGQPIDLSELKERLDKLNANLERDIHSRSSWKLALRNGLLGAIGGVVGSSILVGVVAHFLKPVLDIGQLRPLLERLVDQQTHGH